MHVLIMHLVPARSLSFRLAPRFSSRAGGVFVLLALLSLLPAQGLDKAVLFIGWRAEPETGGLFQALNAGIYRKYGLDVEIRIGSPQSNAEMFLAMNKVDFVGGTTSTAINALAQNIPDVTIAALFQKSPRVLIAHAGVGNDSLPAM